MFGSFKLCIIVLISTIDRLYCQVTIRNATFTFLQSDVSYVILTWLQGPNKVVEGTSLKSNIIINDISSFYYCHNGNSYCRGCTLAECSTAIKQLTIHYNFESLKFQYNLTLAEPKQRTQLVNLFFNCGFLSNNTYRLKQSAIPLFQRVSIS